MDKKYLYINMLDISAVRQWFDELEDNIRSGSQDVSELNKTYIKEELSAEEFILLDGVYYSIIDSESTRLKVVRDDLQYYKSIDEFEKLKEAFDEVKRIKKYNRGIIADKIAQAEALVEESEQIADKFNIELSWVNKCGYYSNGDWNTSSSLC